MDDVNMSDDDIEEEPIEVASSTKALTTTSSGKVRIKKGIFRTDWLSINAYSSWLQEIKHEPTKARCKACLKTFSVHSDGKSAVEKHMISNSHKKSMKLFENNCSLVQFITPEHELDKIAAVECVLVFHGVKHGHSYKSQACTVDLIRNVFESSLLAKSISCGRTKARSITCNILGSYFTKRVIDDLLNSRFYSLSIDASNKGNCKMFPFTVQYFSEIGVSRGLIEFISDPNEAAVDIFKNICKIIDDYKLKFENLTSYGADNANVNFGEYHSVFKLLKDKVSHLLKVILSKFVPKIRWLSLLRSIQRLLETFEPVKLFFLTQETPSNVLRLLKSFFDNDEGLCILHFLQNVLSDIQQAELQLQRSYTTAVVLYFIITSLINKLRQKLSDKYYGNNTRLVSNDITKIDPIRSEEIMKAFDVFINTVIGYIESYFNYDSEFYEKLSFFNSQSFNLLTWKNVIDVVDLIHIDDLDIDQLYSEFCDIKCLYDNLKKKSINLSDQVKSYISSKTNGFSTTRINHQNVVYDDNDDEEIISLSNKQTEDFIRSDQLWAYLLNINPYSKPNFQKVICYIFSIPCSNSYVESIFSHTKHVWTDYRNRMDIELINAELIIRMNGNYSCEGFYKHILSQTSLLKQIRKNAKCE
ncbi:unnamed protein product [Rotaria sp. Silwood1]|nr:unnamed protein product [Rotaria sp. Silwood1]